MARRKPATLGEALRADAPTPPPEVPTQTPVTSPSPTTAVNVQRVFRVIEEARVKRGSTYYTLPKGKLVSSFSYDLDELIAAGVQLEPVVLSV